MSYSTEVLADTPYAYWPDWSAAPVEDATAGNHDITISGATMDVAGPLVSGDTKAGQFDGTNDYGSVALDLTGTSVITVEYWLWWDAFSNNDDMVMEFSASAPGNAGAFWVLPNESAGKFEVYHHYDTNNSKDYTRADFSTGAWHHLAAVLDFSQAAADEITAYLDGALWTGATQQYSGNNNDAGTFGNYTLYLMSRGGTDLFGAGKLAHPAVYKSALSAGRIDAHYDAGLAAGGAAPPGRMALSGVGA